MARHSTEDHGELVATFAGRFAELVGDKSCSEIGKEIDVSKSTVCSYLNGTREPKMPVLKSIARTYNVSPKWLAGYDAPKYTADTNDDLREYLDVLRTRPECRVLLSSAKSAAKKDVCLATAIIELLKGRG